MEIRKFHAVDFVMKQQAETHVKAVIGESKRAKSL